MSCLHEIIDLKSYIETFGVETFFETGSGLGTAIQYSRQFNFKKIYSVEIVRKQAGLLADKFKEDARITIFRGKSLDIFETFLPALDPTPIFFWLDAHYPGADLGENDYDYEKDLDLRLPLEKELDAIWRLRNGKDVIMCDDLRIYEHGPFTSKNLDECGYGHIAKYDSRFLERWEKTHNISRLYEDTGVLIMEPKC